MDAADVHALARQLAKGMSICGVLARKWRIHGMSVPLLGQRCKRS
jgi:hypothetical protein